MQYDRYGNYPPPRRRRRRVKARFFVFLLVFIAIIVFAVWGVSSLLGGSKTMTLGYGRLEKGSSADALIMRQEFILPLTSYSKVQYHATENQTVQVGDSVMTTYKLGYANTYAELENIRKEISRIHEENLLSGIKDSDVEWYNATIAAKTDEITSFARGGRSGVSFVDLERDLRQLLFDRQDFIKKKQPQSADARLNALYADEKVIEDSIASYKQDYYAEVAGRVSYLFDGYEYLLKPVNLPGLTAETVSGLISSAAAPTVPPEERDTALPPMYRIVTPDEWYTLLLVKEKEWSFAEGTTCDISFSGFDDMLFTAKVQSVTGNGDQALIVLSMSEDIGPLINARKVTAILDGWVEGFMVPQKAIKDNGPNKGVYTEDGQVFIPVNVKGMDDYGNALVESVEEGKLTPGMVIRAK